MRIMSDDIISVNWIKSIKVGFQTADRKIAKHARARDMELVWIPTWIKLSLPVWGVGVTQLCVLGWSSEQTL